jgi:hypothetical protein
MVDRNALAKRSFDQNHLCAICSVQIISQEEYEQCLLAASTERFSTPWAVDHEHFAKDEEKKVPQQVRGLLCTACNLGLGKLGDNFEGLVRATAYLARFEQLKSGYTEDLLAYVNPLIPMQLLEKAKELATMMEEYSKPKDQLNARKLSTPVHETTRTYTMEDIESVTRNLDLSDSLSDQQ